MGAAASLEKHESFAHDPVKWENIKFPDMGATQFALCSCTSAKVSKLMNGVSDENELVESLKSHANLYTWFRPERYCLSRQLPNGGFVAVVEFRVLDFRYRIVCYKTGLGLSDWLSSVTFGHSERNPEFTDMHTGILTRSMDIPAKLLVFLNGTTSEEMPVIFTGHSLGGAIAQAAALPLLHHGNVFVITFGSPSIVGSDGDWVDTFQYGKRICRYYFADDPIPTVLSRVKPTVAFEHLVEISGLFRETAALEVSADEELSGSPLSAIASARGGDPGLDLADLVDRLSRHPTIKEKHSPLRYVSPFIGQFAKVSLQTVALERIDLTVGVEEIHSKVEMVDHRVLLKVSGVGLNSDPTRSSIIFNTVHDGESRVHQCHGDCDIIARPANISSIGSSTSRVVVKKTMFESWFDITRVTMNFNEAIDEISVGYKMSNGFDSKVVLVTVVPARSVAFVGQVGHGKSHLVDSLAHNFVNEPYSGFDPGWKQAEDHRAHCFLHGGVFFYELPGLVASTGTFQKKIERKFHDYTPSVLVVVFKSGEKFSPEGLPRLIESLRSACRSSKDLGDSALESVVKIVVVLTMSPPFVKSHSSLRHLVEGLGLREDVDVVQVNSVELVFNDHVIPSQGIPDLGKLLMYEAMIPSALSHRALDEWWSIVIWKFTGVAATLVGAAVVLSQVLHPMEP